MKKYSVILMILLMVCLCGCVSESTLSTDRYFYDNDIKIQRVNVNSRFAEQLPDKMNMVVRFISSYSEGDLYELYLDYEEEFTGRFDDGWDRLNLGYFFVCEDKIYRIKQTEAEGIITWTEEELRSKGSLVCQEEQLEDVLEEDQEGFHERIDVEGDLREYISYENYGETNFFEHFVWKKGEGLMSYRCGYGALSMYLEIYPTDNSVDDEAMIVKLENVYNNFLKGEEKVFYTDMAGDICRVPLWRLPALSGEKSCQYLYLDVDNDGVEELHIRANSGEYYLIDYEKEELKVLYEDASGCVYPIHDEEVIGLLYYSKNDLSGETIYCLFEIDQDGKCLKSPAYIFQDINMNGEFDEEDEYFCEDIAFSGNRVEISMGEWMDMVDVYVYVNNDVVQRVWNITLAMSCYF